MAEVRLSSSAEKQFLKLQKNIKSKVGKALLKLEADPFIGKKLKGELAGQYSLKVWPYRIIYQFDPDKKIVYVISIIHRQGAYK